MNQQEFSAVTPEFERLAKLCESHDVIDPELYTKYQVKRGLRDLDGKGVLTGLTEISTIISSEDVNGELTFMIWSEALLPRNVLVLKKLSIFCSSVSCRTKKSLQISTRCSVPTGSCHIILQETLY